MRSLFLSLRNFSLLLILALGNFQGAGSSQHGGGGGNNEHIWWNQDPNFYHQGADSQRNQNYGQPPQVPPGRRRPNELPRRQFDPNAQRGWDTEDEFDGEGPAFQEDFRADLASKKVEEFTKAMPKRLLFFNTCGLLGMMMGLSVSNALLHQPLICGVAGYVLAVALGLWKNSMAGGLLRAAALALIWAVARSKRFRHGYPLLSQVRASLRLGPRKIFPPGAENPWQYEQQFPDDVAFSMTKAVVACGFLGLFTGWSIAKSVNIFILPTWLLSLGGLGCAVYLTMMRNAFGDLFRCLGMKIVAFLGLLREVDEELHVSGKLMALLRAIFRKLLFFDRKFKITDRIFDALQRIFGQATQLAGQMRESMDERGAGGERRPPRRPQGEPNWDTDDPTDEGPYRRNDQQESNRAWSWDQGSQNGQDPGYGSGSGYR